MRKLLVEALNVVSPSAKWNDVWHVCSILSGRSRLQRSNYSGLAPLASAVVPPRRGVRYDGPMQKADSVEHADRAAFEQPLYEALGALRVRCLPEQVERLWRHYMLMVEANRQFNLTRITQPADAAVKHYADSLSLLSLPGIAGDAALRVLDVGTGPGLPAVPLAVLCPAWRILAIDGTGKKARFVAEAVVTLGLANIKAQHIRAADLARSIGGDFDLVVLRAVSTMAAGVREAGGLVRAGGRLVFYKTPQIAAEEYAEGLQAGQEAGLALHQTEDLAFGAGPLAVQRRLIALRREGRKR